MQQILFLLNTNSSNNALPPNSYEIQVQVMAW